MSFTSDCNAIVDALGDSEGITIEQKPMSLNLYTDTWRVVWYQSPTGHRHVGVQGYGDAAVDALKVVDGSEFLKQVEEKWRWLQDNPGYISGWGVVKRRDAQRGMRSGPEVEVQPKLVFGKPLPEGEKVTRRKR